LTTTRKIGAVLALLMILAGACGWLGWKQYQQFLVAPLTVGEGGSVFVVEPGMTGRAVIARLSRQGFSHDAWPWRVLFRLQPAVLQAGEYQLTSGITPPEFLRMLAEGEVIRYRFTLVEGWTYRQVVDALYADPVLGDWLRENVTDASLRLAHSLLGPAEGSLLPETYVFTRSENALQVLDRAADAMNQALTEAWELRTPDHPVKSPYELLVLASIIEKETALDSERAQVSGVFVRRLQRGMRLQTDPTVVYGLGAAYDGNIRRRDLETDTPYNTYTRAGLPPTPIAMPGRASLLAAAQPADGDALYFVADGKGGHVFSATLEEHQRGVDRLTGKN
jgi:UPF0755 protein